MDRYAQLTMILPCDRCDAVADTSATVEVFAVDGCFRWNLCVTCHDVLYRTLSPTKGQAMTHLFVIYSDDINVDDLDDAEHAHACVCEDCQPDFKYDYQREERYA
jgi:hypothetical protein